jgi:DNA-binding response OmpR family regulator
MPKILIIEDEADIARVLAKRLLAEKLEVITATDAYQGFSSAIKERPDLIILDLMLPAGGGLSVLKNIRASSNIINTPVVVITGIQDAVYEQKVKDEGVEAFIKKPYDYAELKGILQDILSKSGSL